jgi:sialate O-acetylesterase
MKTNRFLPIVAPLFSLATALTAPAALWLPAVISSHAILQSGKPIAIWGWADPGDVITVSLKAGDAQAEGFVAATAANGHWSGQLAAMKPAPRFN